MKSERLSNRLLLEVGKPVLVGLHGAEDLLDGVAGQHDEVDQQKRPEDIDFYHLEIGAHRAHDEGESSALPDLDLTQRTRQGLVLGVLQAEAHSLIAASAGSYLLSERENRLVLLFSFVLVLCNSAGREVADEELEEVEANEVGEDVVGGGLHSLKVGEEEDKSGSPPGLAVEGQLVDEAVVEPAWPADRPSN